MDVNTYLINIKPQSAFGTPLKGDTIFGQFCWQVAEDPSLAQKGLDELVNSYEEQPFVVFSSAWPSFRQDGQQHFALPRPELPPSILGEPEGITTCAERLRRRKENNGRKWFIVSRKLDDQLDWDRLVDDSWLFNKVAADLPLKEKRTLVLEGNRQPVIYFEQQHNTINRSYFTTGKGMFAPYSMPNMWYMPGMELAVFVALKPNLIDIDQVKTGLERIGSYGFGRDASTGLGRFIVSNIAEIKWPAPSQGQEVFTVGPCVPEKGRFEKIYFQPFTRFGRHGAQLLYTRRPFKNPVLMAAEGAVFKPRANDRIATPWLGSALRGVSKAMKKTVVQGFGMALPLRLN